ncbi:hypothetical protein HUE57_09310 [Candidatus Reidiella endopervernicosa]|uniref:Uncharacterized protein n=2 Tax=Candidatus Reidiella endopervernicosa TaxID=2738883 RepID=A0A6N0HW24_9GAMM|nr:hypothetical protein HUE57_09310 [Candidatus Reidiella endopervernicosa]
MPEWVADNETHYIEICVGLAKEPQHLAELRPRLREAMTRSSLMDVEAYTRSFESCLINIADQQPLNEPGNDHETHRCPSLCQCDAR